MSASHWHDETAKSTFASALALYWLAEESRRDPGGEIYILTTDEKQARIIFRICRLMVFKNKHLRNLLQIRQSPANISNPLTHSLLEVLSSKVESKAGRNASLVIIDETKSLPSRELYDVMETSMGSRAEGLLLSLSTSGSNEGSFYFELLTYARKVCLIQISIPRFCLLSLKCPKKQIRSTRQSGPLRIRPLMVVIEALRRCEVCEKGQRMIRHGKELLEGNI